MYAARWRLYAALGCVPDCASCAAEDAGLTSVAWEYKPEYRSCCRAVVRSSALADTLWTRLQSVRNPPTALRSAAVRARMRECQLGSAAWPGGFAEPAPRGRVLRDSAAQVLVRTDVDGRVPVGFDVGGTWVPIGLNDVLRVSRYDKGTQRICATALRHDA